MVDFLDEKRMLEKGERRACDNVTYGNALKVQALHYNTSSANGSGRTCNSVFTLTYIHIGFKA